MKRFRNLLNLDDCGYTEKNNWLIELILVENG